MGSTHEVYMKWNEFASHFKEGFCELRENEELFDITLASGSRQIKAHKVILSACSSFFRSIIRSVSSHQHPLIYLKGIDFNHLEAILAFMYNGEVKVGQEDLESLLSVAQELEIKGLSNSLSPIKQESSSSNSLKKFSHNTNSLEAPSSSSSHSSLSRNRRQGSQSRVDEIIIDDDKPLTGSPLQDDDDFGQENHEEDEGSYDEEDPSLVDTILSTPFIDPSNNTCDDEDELESMMDMESESIFNESESMKGLNYVSHKPGYTQALNSEISKCFDFSHESKKYLCKMCEYTSPRRDTMRCHVEAIHIITDGFECTLCGKIYKTRNSLKTHKIRKHKRKGLQLDPNERIVLPSFD